MRYISTLKNSVHILFRAFIELFIMFVLQFGAVLKTFNWLTTLSTTTFYYFKHGNLIPRRRPSLSVRTCMRCANHLNVCHLFLGSEERDYCPKLSQLQMSGTIYFNILQQSNCLFIWYFLNSNASGENW